MVRSKLSQLWNNIKQSISCHIICCVGVEGTVVSKSGRTLWWRSSSPSSSKGIWRKVARKECQQKRQLALANETRFYRVDEENIACKVQQGSILPTVAVKAKKMFRATRLDRDVATIPYCFGNVQYISSLISMVLFCSSYIASQLRVWCQCTSTCKTLKTTWTLVSVVETVPSRTAGGLSLMHLRM